MWRSNALSLRIHSSRPLRALCSANGLHTLPRGGGAQPVSGDEFERTLAAVLKARWNSRSKNPIGFAVSGGVDSMALAALYAAARETNPKLPRGHGFIVDHRVRPESTEEALWVAEQLRQKFDMHASVLPLSWPADFDPKDTRRFETDARTLRYQALGRACRDNDIAHLLVAHHADDQAETVMMRFMNNRLRSGLQGMHIFEWIPECRGMYGVHHSGKERGKVGRNMPFAVEDGGIQIVRPLLGFEKARLVATCEERGVEWAEDKTNHMQTYTSRNAIRHVYKNHKLPEALSIQSLVEVSLDMQARIEAHKSYARELFDKCRIRLDMQTGSVFVRLPPYESLLNRPIETSSDMNEARNNAYCLLERVANLVTPKDKVPLSKFAASVENIWPQFRDHDAASIGTIAYEVERNYCVYGVWWRWWGKPSPFDKDAVTEYGFATQPPHPREWLLTRQPPESAGKNSEAYIEFPPVSSLDTTVDDFRLFDGRFWIRITNHTLETLVLRLFTKNDKRHIPPSSAPHSHDGPRPERYIATALSLLKPADLHFTLPAVFRIDATTGAESLVGFPTLNVGWDSLGHPAHICEWEVRYKKLDTGTRSPADVVVPGVSHELIEGTIAKNVIARAAQVKARAKKAAAGKKGAVVSAVETAVPGSGSATVPTTAQNQAASKKRKPFYHIRARNKLERLFESGRWTRL